MPPLVTIRFLFISVGSFMLVTILFKKPSSFSFLQMLKVSRSGIVTVLDSSSFFEFSVSSASIAAVLAFC